jgi:hypothetical protein
MNKINVFNKDGHFPLNTFKLAQRCESKQSLLELLVSVFPELIYKKFRKAGKIQYFQY